MTIRLDTVQVIRRLHVGLAGVSLSAHSGVIDPTSSTFVNSVCEVRVNLNLSEYQKVELLYGTPIYWTYGDGLLVFSLPANSGGTPFAFRVRSIYDGMGACNSQNMIFFTYGQNGSGMSFVVAPNPVEDNLNIFIDEGYGDSPTILTQDLTTKKGETFKKSEFQYTLQVLDILNHRHVKSFKSKRGSLNENFNVSDLPSGAYSAVINYGKQTETVNFLKK